MLCDPAGVQLAELGTARDRLLAFQRNTYGEATFTLSHDDDAAQLLLDTVKNAGIPTLRCYRQGTNDPAGVLRLNGYLAAINETADPDAAALAATFRGPFSRLLGDGADRGRFTSAAFTATDAGQIAKNLLDAPDGANLDGYTGLGTTGTIQATKLRDRLYVNTNVGEAIVNLTRVRDGFDFEEAYVAQGTTLAVLNVYASQGSVQPNARFEYGPNTIGNVRSLQRTIQQPINRAKVLGANGLVGTAQDNASIAKYGLWPIQQGAPDVLEQTTLDDKARALLRPNPVKTIAFVPELAISPLPWEDFWLGDTIRFFASRGALQEDLTVRVNAITIAIDDTGREATSLEQSNTDLLDLDPAAQAFADAAATLPATPAPQYGGHGPNHSTISVEALDGASV